ncbi:hypothetical protein [Sphingobacterium sp. LRF_L2]|uniref:hypothetical protein n=1 Tax=Sphingobacterium sp. LRF_L2 TaxID=3369421 RepID=UPI003F615EEC
MIVRLLNYIAYTFLALVLVSISSCSTEYTDPEEIHLSFDVDTSKLNLPEGTVISFSEANLTMIDYNRWNQMLTYSITDVESGVHIPKGYYYTIIFKANMHYTLNAEEITVPVSCYVNGHIAGISSRSQNMLDPEMRATLPLERSTQ